jgi:hypothetical protein
MQMAVIHHTTLTPGKLELLAAWLPAQPWYARTGRQPELSRAGGFRLDDPDGEVGIEFMVVTDSSGDRPCIYHVPLSYRGAPLDGADDALIGTTEHGVLGTRWVYDGPRDPVLFGQLLALIQGEAEPQAQGVSNAPDRTVSSHFAGPRAAASLSLKVIRVLEPMREEPQSPGYVTATWRARDGTEARGVFAEVRA